ncbi:MAG: hypothetical protein JXA21_20765 [Anaerolineae bacterium]|nr:hypothetical protein [Anaerolineae bacterium]
MSIKSIRFDSMITTGQGPQSAAKVQSKPYNGEILKITTMGHPIPLEVTPEHHLLTVEGWREARSLHPGDWLVYPIPTGVTTLDELHGLLPSPPATKSKRPPRITGAKQIMTKDELQAFLEQGLTYQQIAERYGRKTRSFTWEYAILYGLTPPAGNVIHGDPLGDPDFWRVVGYWLAEGTITYGRKSSPNVVRWTFGYAEQGFVDDVTQVLSRYGLTVLHHNLSGGGFKTEREFSSINTTCSSVQLAVFLSLFGVGAHNKNLPEWTKLLPCEYAQQLLRGYLDGDGYVTPDGWARIGSVSLSLLEGFRTLLLRLNVVSSIMANGAKKYELRFHVSDTPWLGKGEFAPIEKRGSKIENGQLLVKIRCVEIDDYDGLVYDL